LISALHKNLNTTFADDKHRLSVDHAYGHTLVAEDGQKYIDLVAGFGSVFLGHCNDHIRQQLQNQVSACWSIGRFDSISQQDADTALNEFIQPHYRSAGLYSTGMEAIEYAMRVAAAITGRREFVGCSQSMHGKSGCTASLAWKNAALKSEQCHILPFGVDVTEAEVFAALEDRLSRRTIAAVFIEPIQASSLCFEPARTTFEGVMDLCKRYQTLCIFDEYLTGLFRTGTRFYVDRFSDHPDISIIGKCLGNGFPVSAVCVKQSIEIPEAALPGSTFSNNPLAAAATAGTLDQMSKLNLALKVQRIDDIVRQELGCLQNIGAVLRGRGALWGLQLPDRLSPSGVVAGLRHQGILVTGASGFVRLLPMATMDPTALKFACEAIVDVCLRAAK